MIIREKHDHCSIIIEKLTACPLPSAHEGTVFGLPFLALAHSPPSGPWSKYRHRGTEDSFPSLHTTQAEFPRLCLRGKERKKEKYRYSPRWSHRAVLSRGRFLNFEIRPVNLGYSKAE